MFARITAQRRAPSSAAAARALASASASASGFSATTGMVRAVRAAPPLVRSSGARRWTHALAKPQPHDERQHQSQAAAAGSAANDEATRAKATAASNLYAIMRLCVMM